VTGYIIPIPTTVIAGTPSLFTVTARDQYGNFIKGKAVTLVMTRKTDQTCAKEVLFPSLNKRYPLPLNQAVRIDLPASQKGTLSYQCGEKMIGGQVVIE